MSPTTTDVARIKLSCPHCLKTVAARHEHRGKTVRCPKCKKIFRIADPAPPPPISVTAPSIVDRYRKQYRLERFIEPAFNLFLLIVFSVVVLIAILKGVSYAQSNHSALKHTGAQLGIWLFVLAPLIIPLLYFLISVHKIRAARNIMYYGFWLGLPITLIFWVSLAGLGTEGIFGFVVALISSVILCLPWYCLAHYPARWFTPYFLAMIFWKLRCPHCHETHQFCDRWSCSCGYTDHRDNRHLLLFSCPKCQSHIGYMECPRCESTILV